VARFYALSSDLCLEPGFTCAPLENRKFLLVHHDLAFCGSVSATRIIEPMRGHNPAEGLASERPCIAGKLFAN
jgi:hypothetical protein